eukprot:8041844-Pyramimonas_sp.AAC.1
MRGIQVKALANVPAIATTYTIAGKDAANEPDLPCEVSRIRKSCHSCHQCHQCHPCHPCHQCHERTHRTRCSHATDCSHRPLALSSGEFWSRLHLCGPPSQGAIAEAKRSSGGGAVNLQQGAGARTSRGLARLAAACVPHLVAPGATLVPTRAPPRLNPTTQAR